MNFLTQLNEVKDPQYALLLCGILCRVSGIRTGLIDFDEFSLAVECVTKERFEAETNVSTSSPINDGMTVINLQAAKDDEPGND